MTTPIPAEAKYSANAWKPVPTPAPAPLWIPPIPGMGLHTWLPPNPNSSAAAAISWPSLASKPLPISKPTWPSLPATTATALPAASSYEIVPAPVANIAAIASATVSPTNVASVVSPTNIYAQIVSSVIEEPVRVPNSGTYGEIKAALAEKELLDAQSAVQIVPPVKPDYKNMPVDVPYRAPAQRVYCIRGGYPDGMGAGWAVWHSLSVSEQQRLKVLGGLSRDAIMARIKAAATAAAAAPVAAPTTAITSAPAAITSAPAAPLVRTWRECLRTVKRYRCGTRKAAKIAHLQSKRGTECKNSAEKPVHTDWRAYITLCHHHNLPAIIPVYRDKPLPADLMYDCDVTLIGAVPDTVGKLSALAWNTRSLRVWTHYPSDAITLLSAASTMRARGFSFVCDASRSDAQIAWDMIHGTSEPRPPFLDMIAGQSMHKDPLAINVTKALVVDGFTRSFESLDLVADDPDGSTLAYLGSAGASYVRGERAYVVKIRAEAVTMTVHMAGQDYQVRAVNAGILMDEIATDLAMHFCTASGARVANRPVFAIAWKYDINRAEYRMSLRAPDKSPIDLDYLVKNWDVRKNGGGSAHAAGAAVDAQMYNITDIFWLGGGPRTLRRKAVLGLSLRDKASGRHND